MKYIDAEKLKDEIKKRISLFQKEKKTEGASQIDIISLGARAAALEEILTFIDSLQQEPDKSLEEAAEKYRRVSCNAAMKPNIDGPIPEYGGNVKTAFIAGAEWQTKQLMKDAIHYVVQDDLDSHGASYNIPFIRIGINALKPKGIGVGDKVHIIIEKEN